MSAKLSRAVMPFEDALLAKMAQKRCRNGAKKCERGGGKIGPKNVPSPILPRDPRFESVPRDFGFEGCRESRSMVKSNCSPGDNEQHELSNGVCDSGQPSGGSGIAAPGV